MKKVFVMMSMLLSLGLFCACSSDDENDVKNNLRYWDCFRDVTGQMTYNEDLQAWHFISRWPYGPVGPTLDLYPIELEDEFKVEGLVVTLSGDIFIDDENQRYYIELTKIDKNSKYPPKDKDGFYPLENEECFSAQVTTIEDGDSIKAVITENPAWDSYAFFAPHKNSSVILLKSDLLNPDIQKGDVIDFWIVRYKMLSIIDNGPETYCNEFFCIVKPCK